MTTTPQYLVRAVGSGGQLDINVLSPDDNVGYAFGTDSDAVFYLSSDAIGSADETTGLHAGTSSVKQATAVDSLIISNITTDGDIQMLVSDGDSKEFLFADGSAAILYLGHGMAATTIKNVNQIAFLASDSASADANTLDDYEEGSFTPSLVDGDYGDDESQTYSSNRVGRYTKIGNLVHFQLYLEMTSLGSLTAGDAASIIGLPFTSDSTSGTHPSVHVGFAGNLAIAAESAISGVITPNTQRVGLKLWDAATGTTNLLISEISANGLLGVSGSYRV